MDTSDTWSSVGSVREESFQVQMCHDKHRVDHHFQVSDHVWLYISKDRLKGEGKKLKLIMYGPFKIVKNIGNNVFWLDLPPYMHIFLVLNVENIKLCEPPMIFDPEEYTQFPTVEDLAPKYMIELLEDTIFNRKVRTLRQGYVEYIWVGLKGMNSSKARWMEIRKLRDLYPQLMST